MENFTKLGFLQSKIQEGKTLERTLELWRFKLEKTVFTNGCFDLLHRGHVEYLTAAASLGDKLIIGLNSDDSVKRLNKGSSRPLQDQNSRAIILAALHYVDLVVIFDEDTPYELIKLIQPNVLVKGGDWKPEQIVGSDIVKANGGEVLSLPYLEGFSTTNIEKKIKGL